MSDREHLSKKTLPVSSKRILWFFSVQAEQAIDVSRYQYIKTTPYEPVETSGKDNTGFPVLRLAWFLEPYNTTQNTGEVLAWK